MLYTDHNRPLIGYPPYPGPSWPWPLLLAQLTAYQVGQSPSLLLFILIGGCDQARCALIGNISRSEVRRELPPLPLWWLRPCMGVLDLAPTCANMTYQQLLHLHCIQSRLLAKATELSLAQGVDFVHSSQDCLQASNNASSVGVVQSFI